MATEDDTLVDVYYPSDATLTDQQFVLNLYEVYTMDTYELPGKPVIDLTGTRVLANKPVAVYSGVGRSTMKALGVRNKKQQKW